MAHSTSPRVCRQPRVVESSVVHTDRGVRLIITSKATASYDILEFPCCDGRLFRLTKDDGNSYDVLIASNGQDHTCDCADMTFRGHIDGPCKHITAMQCRLSEIPDPLEATAIELKEADYGSDEYFQCDCGSTKLVWEDEDSGKMCSRCIECDPVDDGMNFVEILESLRDQAEREVDGLFADCGEQGDRDAAVDGQFAHLCQQWERKYGVRLGAGAK